MNQETFDTITLAPDIVGDDRYLLADNVVDPDPHLQRQADRPACFRPRRADRRLDRAGRARRHGQRQRDEDRATLETGMEIRVPLFIKEGEKIKVHTETREFAGRA